MRIPAFILIGENIHCTRVLKREGKRVSQREDGRDAIVYEVNGNKKFLPIPELFLKSADWTNGKVKHCAAAIWQGMRGTGADQEAGMEYLQMLARKQEEAGATFLDVNVDEFSMDIQERIRVMEWTAALIQKASVLPLSIDSSNAEIMRAGLRACDRARGRPMVNSISLERLALLDVLKDYQPAVVASAAGEKGLPATVEERRVNLERLIPQLTTRGIDMGWVHVDPLVYTISTDPNNGKIFLDSVAAIRRTYGPAIHVIGGLSNVSFGMPCRKLINQVFAWLAVEAGGDGGIVDPLQINAGILSALDTRSESFQLARALLKGEDEFGMNFITAYREGKLG